MQENKTLKIGITIGDMNGVGPEIILKTFADKRMLEFCTPIIYASTRTLEFVKNHFKYNIELNGIKSATQARDNKVNVVNCWSEAPQINFGTKDKNIGKHAVISLKAATSDLKQGHLEAIVTAPINKESIQSDVFNFPGHTDYLDNQIEGKALMLMVSGNLRIGLLTDHIPVSKISKNITKELVENKINTIHKTLVEDFNISKPKIAILGINPPYGTSLQTKLGSVLGPSGTTVGNICKVFYDTVSGEYDYHTARNVRRFLPFQNIVPNGFSFTTTITLGMISGGYRVNFFPIDYFKRSGKSKIRPFRDTVNFIKLIIY